MKSVHIMYSYVDGPIARALAQVIEVLSVAPKTNVQNICSYRTFPCSSELVILIWSPNCGATELYDMLAELNKEIGKSTARDLRFLDLCSLADPFLRYLRENGAKRLVLKEFIPRTISEAEPSFLARPSFSMDLCRLIRGAIDHGDLDRDPCCRDLSTILPRCVEEFLSKPSNLGSD